jgi:FkbM family methyltransferase
MKNKIKCYIQSFLKKRGQSLQLIQPNLHCGHGHLLELDLVELSKAIFTNPTNLKVIQIGAFDGLANDPIHVGFSDLGWHGVLVEPQPGPFQLLKKKHRSSPNVNVIQAAVGQQEGNGIMYKVKMEKWMDVRLEQVTSFNRDHVLKHVDGNQACIETITVRVMSFAAILRESGWKEVDVVLVDTEGFDAEVVNMMLSASIKPSLLRFESAHLSHVVLNALLDKLVRHGYKFIQGRCDITAVLRNN